MHIGNQAIWRCARVKEETVGLSANRECDQSAEAMLRKWALIGSPAFHQRSGHAQFLGTQTCALCDTLIKKQTVIKVVSQDRNGN
jgi:hypothetical protein